MMDERLTDNELVRSCLGGNMDSYRELMERYRGRAMALALNILANFQDAEDATQEAFLRAYWRLEGFDQQRNFKNWFFTLLSHHCLDQVRKKKRYRRLVERLRSTEREALAAPRSNPGALPKIDTSLLKRLRPKERTALYLWSQEGYSGAEIAAVLACSEKTAHVHLFRARAKLKAVLKEGRNASL